MFRFTIGPWKYGLVFVAGLEDEDGQKQLGRCDPNSKTIYLEARLRGDALCETVLHEVRHAWQYSVGMSADPEDDAQAAATVYQAMMLDLSRMGGWAVIEREALNASRAAVPEPADDDLHYQPNDYTDQQDVTAPARAGRAQCGRCSSIIPDGAIVNGKVKWDGEAKGRIVSRTLYCAHCGVLQLWDEGIDVFTNQPNGSVVRGPIWASEGVSEFLRANPNAAGVLAG